MTGGAVAVLVIAVVVVVIAVAVAESAVEMSIAFVFGQGSNRASDGSFYSPCCGIVHVNHG